MFLKEKKKKKQWQFDVREKLTMKEAEDTNFPNGYLIRNELKGFEDLL